MTLNSEQGDDMFISSSEKSQTHTISLNGFIWFAKM
jgi:hypothetical protein